MSNLYKGLSIDASYQVSVHLAEGFQRRRLKCEKLRDLASVRQGELKIGICCFSTKHAALRRKSKDWLARNQDNESEWGDMSIRGLLFQ